MIGILLDGWTQPELAMLSIVCESSPRRCRRQAPNYIRESDDAGAHGEALVRLYDEPTPGMTVQ